MRLVRSLLAIPVLSTALLAGWGRAAHAQGGTVRGTVTDSLGKPIVDAEVTVPALRRATRSDSAGAFLFTQLPRGEHALTVRRFGYAPETIDIFVNDMAYSYAVVLTAQPLRIAGVQINATEERLRLGIEDFYRRRTQGLGGTFFTRAEILQRNARRTSDAVGSAPGVRLVRARSGSGIRFLVGASARRECVPVIWLDGQPVEGMEIDDIPVDDVEGIELYQGSSTTPTQFSQRLTKDACGAIVVWTRIPGRP